MISVPDRRRILELIDEAYTAGASRPRACAELGVSLRTVQRWRMGGAEPAADGRPTAVRPSPHNRLSPAEQAQVLALCHEPAHASLPPSQLVPRLADQGQYVASEATFYRILRAAAEQQYRGRSRRPQRRGRPVTHRAHGPREVWSWDITWLPGPAQGLFYYLYLILDVYSRKIVGWEVYDQETAEQAARVIERAVWAEACGHRPLVLHADNGSPMKAATLRATLDRLGIEPSYSRPRVSNDNPFSEAVFRTCKYHPTYPERGFANLEAARAWVLAFVRWYNTEHRHRNIQYVTPGERHAGEDHRILAHRRVVYEQARRRHPERWTRDIRAWQPVETVWLNPTTEMRERRSRAEVAA